MSFVLRMRRQERKPLPAVGLWLLVGVVVVFFLVRYGSELLREHELRGKVTAQVALNAEVREENERLTARLEYFKSDKYIEERAREDLNLRRADEEVLIPIIVDAPRAVQKEGASPIASPPANADDRPNWERWADLFAPR